MLVRYNLLVSKALQDNIVCEKRQNNAPPLKNGGATMRQQLGVEGDHLPRRDGNSGVELRDAKIGALEVSERDDERDILAVVVEIDMNDFAGSFFDGDSKERPAKVEVWTRGEFVSKFRRHLLVRA